MKETGQFRPSVMAQRRRAHPALRVALAILALVVVCGMGGIAVARFLDRAQLGPVAETPGPDKAHAGNPAPAPSAEPTAPAPPPQPLPEPAPLTAVERAAVRYPGAPAVASDTIRSLHPRHKYIALTLDDGYGIQMGMMELLEKEHVPVTAFLIGNVVASNPDVVRRMADDGFEIANHTWSHATLSTASTQTIESELKRGQDAISEITGNQAPYMRPPGGATNSRVERVSARLGYRLVLWNRSFGDTGGGATPDKVYANVMKTSGGVHAGDIILGHWGSPNTYEALKRIIPELRAKGFEFVTVSELIEDSKAE